MYILGLNAYHGDSSAALIKDGVVLAAAEEERFTRLKHWAGVPIKSIDFCLDFAGITFPDLSHVVINSDSRAHRLKKLAYLFRSRPDLKLVLEKFRSRMKRENILDVIANISNHDTKNVTLHAVEHHLAHLASAYYPAEFDSAALLSVDGFGDFSSAAWGVGNSDQISISEYVNFPHSLGIFYQSITQYLGFHSYGDEYKVMGLASYGEPQYVSQLKEVLDTGSNNHYQLVLKYFRHHNESLQFQWQDGTPEFENIFSRELECLLGPARASSQPIEDKHRNIAASAQYLYEQALFHMLNRIHGKTGNTNLGLAGGCAMNSVANGKIKSNTPFVNVYVQPAAGDAGGAVGAALEVWSKLGLKFEQPVMPDAYLGPGYTTKEISNLLASKKAELDHDKFEIKQWDEDSLIDYAVGQLVDGAVLGWFQGRMEWGPRALGNRSILADPRRTDIQNLLNEKIKRRESFRPFAPSILVEHVSNWFEIDDIVPFMEKVYPVRPEKRSEIPAVTHVDGSGRLQTVDSTRNQRYHKLISAFYAYTGVPILLNTSFNENEPIVCNPEQALNCFLRTNMDVLALGEFTISRNK